MFSITAIFAIYYHECNIFNVMYLFILISFYKKNPILIEGKSTSNILWFLSAFFVKCFFSLTDLYSNYRNMFRWNITNPHLFYKYENKEKSLSLFVQNSRCAHFWPAYMKFTDSLNVLNTYLKKLHKTFKIMLSNLQPPFQYILRWILEKQSLKYRC